jgi:glucose/arabinose dehydrogenase
MVATMRRAAAVGPSPNRITLLRDADGDGVAEQRHVLLDGLKQPFGMALVGGHVLRRQHRRRGGLPVHADGDTRITGRAARCATFKPGGHWTRSLLASPDGRKLYRRGLAQQHRRHGMELPNKAAPASTSWTCRPASCRPLPAACATRWAWPGSPPPAALWTVVNERDGLGDETPPDYLTSVQDGGFYGWPYCYWGRTVDDRVPQDAAGATGGQRA